MDFPSRYKSNAAASLGLAFIKTYNLWHAEIKRGLQPLGLTHPQFVFLACTGFLSQKEEHVTQTMIAGFSDIDVMTVSQLANLLEKKQLIERTPHPTDTRAKSVRLTEKGGIVLQKALPLVEGVDQKFFAPLGERQEPLLHMLLELASCSGKA